MTDRARKRKRDELEAGREGRKTALSFSAARTWLKHETIYHLLSRWNRELNGSGKRGRMGEGKERYRRMCRDGAMGKWMYTGSRDRVLLHHRQAVFH
ncbi:hypothetical protein QQF64_030837 [Cirrhinus molitorella]|uniref:Uncharacterized protein n=1 Tax=Cirrhinus molitorella TaxID=172907 RepID=A0ABR3N4S9_9TELE